MALQWKKVTWYSQIIAIILFVGVFLLGLWLGIEYGRTAAPVNPLGTLVNSVVFSCDAGKSIQAEFYQHDVVLGLSDGRTMTLPQTISADGARYANPDGTFVFWNKGNGAFVEEGPNLNVTYTNCTTPVAQ